VDRVSHAKSRRAVAWANFMAIAIGMRVSCFAWAFGHVALKSELELHTTPLHHISKWHEGESHIKNTCFDTSMPGISRMH
jgi:hypothetical protein